MQITFKRASVCAGDDVMAPNTFHVEFDHAPRLSEVLAEYGPARDYLPIISGHRTLWSAHISTEHIANLALTYAPSRELNVTLRVPDRVLSSGTIWFTYLGQEEATQD